MFILAFVSMITYAQSLTVTGKVLDSEGYEVIGGSVVVKGAAGVGTVTDLDGKYTLKVNDASKDVLVFSYVGMTSQEVKVNNQSVINVTLQADAVLLEDVVVIGYAAVPRRDLTGSVTSVSSKELSKVPVSDVTQALAGRMAGVMVQQSEGTPGASISVRVRGGISITQSNEPLYIIDGFPSEDGMSTLDPAEIETIDVLKDASATAIYGARGANGVVVITTKNGSKSGGKATVTFDSYVGVKKIANKLDVLNAGEFVRLDYERTLWRMGTGDSGADGMTKWEERYGKFSDLASIYNGRKGIDWQDETLGRNAITQNYRVGVSGKTEKMNYSLAYSYYNEEGAMVYSGSKKHNISFNMNHEINKWLTVNSRISYDQMRVEGMGTSEGGDRFNKMQHILQYRPTVGIMGVDEDLLYGEDPLLADDNGNVMQNPLISAAEELNDREWRTFQANGGATIKLLKGLSFRSTVGMRYQTRRNDVFYGDESITGKRSSIQGSITNLENSSFQTSNVLTYSWKNKIHDFTVIAGHEYVERWSRSFSASASQFPNDEIGLGDLSLGVPGVPTSSENYDDKLLSFFGRINYNLMDKYLFTASVRADGSSKFGKNNKWGYFPAFSAAWRLGEEAFIKDLGVFSDLKFRIGYGLAGKQSGIDSYTTLNLVKPNGVVPVGNSAIVSLGDLRNTNPDLKWEVKHTFNTGFDIALFGNRLLLSANYYNSRTTDMLYLYNVSVPPFTYNTLLANIGSMRNWGTEIAIGITPLKTKDMELNINANITFQRNKLLSLSGMYNGEMLSASEYKSLASLDGAGFHGGYNHIVYQMVGQPLGVFYLPHSTGLESDGNGGYTYGIADLNGGGVSLEDGEDRYVAGQAVPKTILGSNISFRYKRFDLSLQINGAFGHKIYNGTSLTYMNMNIFPDYNVMKKAPQQNIKDQTATDYWLEKGDYVNFDYVTLGWNVPIEKVQKLKKYVRSLRLAFTVNNLATISGYSGLSPMINSSTVNSTLGVDDKRGYPLARTYTLGLSINF